MIEKALERGAFGKERAARRDIWSWSSVWDGLECARCGVRRSSVLYCWRF